VNGRSGNQTAVQEGPVGQSEGAADRRAQQDDAGGALPWFDIPAEAAELARVVEMFVGARWPECSGPIRVQDAVVVFLAPK
jgi:hypothetical protein